MAGPAPIRLGGRTELPSGDVVVWSVAGGRRGRRWRSTTRGPNGGSFHGLLVETGPDARLVRFEAVASIGLMTLHPESDESALHGNVVEDGGVGHLALPWGPDHALLSFDEPILVAICLGSLARVLAPGDVRRIQVQYVDPVVLDLEPGEVVVERLGPESWRLLDPASESESTTRLERTVRLDPFGLLDLPGEIRWPLELGTG